MATNYDQYEKDANGIYIIPDNADPWGDLMRRNFDALSANKVNMPVFVPPGADLNNYKTAGLFYAPSKGSGMANIPAIDSNEIQGFSLLVQKNNSDNGVGVAQTLTTYRKGWIYQRVLWSSTWQPWVRLATAEPPQIFDLSYTTLVKPSAGYTCAYWKSQENIVTVVFSLSTIDGATKAFNHDVIAILPEGFRPPEKTGVPINFSAASSLAPSGGLGLIRTNGEITAWSGAFAAISMHANFSFVAAP